MPGCELMDRCIQCATCSAVCPLSAHMERTPRRIIELTRNGFRNDVLSSNTIWVCASCYQCQVECPKQIGITDIMYALKTKAIASGFYPKRFPTAVLAKEFFAQVQKNGRLTETILAQNVFLKTNPLKVWGMRKLGIRLIRAKRYHLKPLRLKHPQSFQQSLSGLKPLDGKSSPRPEASRPTGGAR
ncbi:MAG TPA: 4Fe-4S dicluster domain-containing protein [Fimbriimonas sp.]